MRAALVALTVFASSPAWGQNQCQPYPDMRAWLLDNFGEHEIGEGQISPTLYMQVFANEETGTWTFVFIDTDGMACIGRSGDAYTVIAAPVGEPL